jgi:uncharacterized lipoprotein YmbA
MKRVFLILSTAWIFIGCSSPYPSFYTLSAEGLSPSGGGLGIGVGPVILAEYVDRTNLVVQTSDNKIDVAVDHLWAGDLDNSISRVISINLGRKLETGNIRSYPWQRDSEIDYQVAMDISEFVAGNDGFAHLQATWRIYKLPSRRMVRSNTFVGKEPISSGDFEAMVAAQSRLLGKLSEEIAQGIRKNQ